MGDQNIWSNSGGHCSLHGTGKNVKILAYLSSENEKALAAGAGHTGAEGYQSNSTRMIEFGFSYSDPDTNY